MSTRKSNVQLPRKLCEDQYWLCLGCGFIWYTDGVWFAPAGRRITSCPECGCNILERYPDFDSADVRKLQFFIEKLEEERTE